MALPIEEANDIKAQPERALRRHKITIETTENQVVIWPDKDGDFCFHSEQFLQIAICARGWTVSFITYKRKKVIVIW